MVYRNHSVWDDNHRDIKRYLMGIIVAYLFILGVYLWIVAGVQVYFGFSFLAAVGNLIWFTLAGWALALISLIEAGIFAITIIGLPLSRVCLELAKLSAFPFGQKVIRETELEGGNKVSTFSKVLHIILNIIWFPFGLFMTVVYIVEGILLIVSIIGIPVGIVYIKMGKFTLFPFGARVVTK